MSSTSPELVALATSTCVLAGMIMLGISKGLLSRSPLRQCPSCGRFLHRGRCACN